MFIDKGIIQINGAPLLLWNENYNIKKPLDIFYKLL